MSWLNVFGRKKHKESPPDTLEEEQPPQDDFIFVEKRNPTPPNTDNIPTRLYPSLDGGPSYPTTIPTGSATMNQQADCTYYLSGVPFKFCKQLERKINSDFDVDLLRVNEILSFIKRIQNENYDYDFSTEEAVIAEMSSTNNQYEEDE